MTRCKNGRRVSGFLLPLACCCALAVVTSSASAACPNEAIREAQGTTYLPDCMALEMVADLRGPGYLPIRFELVGRTDSVNGLIVNSRNVCLGHNRAKASFEAHNGRTATLRPELFNKGFKGKQGSERGKADNGRQGRGGNRGSS